MIHLIRPWWLCALLPLTALLWQIGRKASTKHAWNEVCDAHLLPYITYHHGRSKKQFALGLFFISGLLFIISLAGPGWHQLPAPAYQRIQPRIILLDLSSNMLVTDVSPNRLTRAKFKLHDLLTYQEGGQFGLVAFTSQPFVVSPITDDANTIDALLPVLTPDIMPVDGQQLDKALMEAASLITQAGYNQGELLVLTANPADKAANQTAENLAKRGISTSVMPIVADPALNVLFQPLAKAGRGQLLPFSSSSKDLEQWLKTNNNLQYKHRDQSDFPLWQDEGPWFLLAGLLILLPVFRRGWLQRMDV